MFIPNSLHHLSNLIERIYFACLDTLQKVLHSYEPFMSYLFSLRIYRSLAYTKHTPQFIQGHILSHVLSHFNFVH